MQRSLCALLLCVLCTYSATGASLQRRPRSHPAMILQRVDPAPVISDWRKAVDPGSGRTYYWHVRTRESTWQCPEELRETPLEPDAQDGQSEPQEEDKSPMQQTQQQPASAAPPVLARLSGLAQGARDFVMGAPAGAFTVRGRSADGETAGSMRDTLAKGAYLGGVLAFGAAVL